jgi:hypothetical protein
MANRLIWHEEAIVKAAQGSVEARMGRAVIVVRDQVKVLINRGNATGRDPSAPGEPPKKVSGRLFKSISSLVTLEANGNVIGLIGSDAPYAARLELGFVGTDRLGRVYNQAPRPAFRPALAMSLGTIKRIFGNG